MRKYILLTALIICSKVTFAQVKISDMPTYTGNLTGGWFPMVISGTNRKFPGDSIVRRSELNAFLTGITGSQVTTALGYTPLNETDLYPYVTSGLAATLYTPKTRTLTINGESFDLSDNRSWTISSLPSQTGNSGKYLTTNGTTASWGTVTDSYLSSSWHSTTNNASNWDIAYGWGNHASAGYLTSSTASTTYASLTGSYYNPSWITGLAWSKIIDATSNSRSAISLTTTGTGGAATYNLSTGVLNVPQYNSIDYDAANIWTNTNTFKKDGIGTTITNGIDLLNSTQSSNQYSPSLSISNYKSVSGVYKLNSWKLYSMPSVDAGLPTLTLANYLDGVLQSTPFVFGAGGSLQVNSSFQSASITTGQIGTYIDGTTNSRDGMILQPTSTGGASSGQIVKYSPRIRLSGFGWTGSTSQTASFIQEVRPTSGTNPITAQMVISSSVAGGSYTDRISITDGGSLLIGTTTDVTSSTFTIVSTTKGFLPPRMTKTQRNSIASPAAGLIVVVTGESGGEYLSIYNANQTRWEKVNTTSD